MKKPILVILGLLLVGCSLRPVQVVERAVQGPGEATKAIEPQQPSPTATALATALPALQTPTAAPTQPPASPTPTLPATYTPAGPTPATIVYVVQAGDTLARIAARFQVSVEAIAAENGIADVNQIAVGQALTMPAGAVTPQATEPPKATATHTPAPADASTPARTVAPDTTAPQTEKDWPGICHPSPTKEGARVADLNIGETVELTGYLYVKGITTVANEKIVFSFCPAPYQSYASGEWSDRCTIHAWIRRDKAGKPNHVREYGSTWPSVVILDKDGREIRGYSRSLDSRHVRLKGTVVKPYGTATGLGGSHTIDVAEIELLE